MKNQKIYSPREKILLFVLLLASVLSLLFFFLYKTLAFPEYNINFSTDRNAADLKSKEFLTRQGIKVSDYKDVTVFDIDDNAKTFLERETSVETTAKLAGNEIDLWHFQTRFFEPLQKEEYEVAFLPNGRISGYSRIIEENREGAKLTKEQAKKIAERFLLSQTQIKLNEWNFIDDNTVVLKNRVDYQFDWERKNLDIHDATYRMRVGVQGDKIGEYSEFLKVPETWQRQYEKERSQNNLAQLVAEVFAFLLFGISFIIFFIIRFKNNKLHFRFGLIVAVIACIITFAASLNSLPLTVFGYDTTQSWDAFIGQIIFEGLYESVATSMLYFFIIVVGESFYRQLFPQRIALANLFGKGLASKEVNKNLFVGSFFGVISFGYIVLFYILGKNIGFWSPAEISYSDAFSTVIPWIYPVFIGFSAAIFEEGLFRLFGIPFVLQFVKKPWLAVFITAFCWSFLHSNYPQSPWYARGVEVGLEGLLWGFLYLRFGILTTLTAHYTFDALITSIALASSANVFNTVISVLLSLVPLLFAISLLIYAVRKNGFFTDVQQLTNKYLTDKISAIKQKVVKPIQVIASAYSSSLNRTVVIFVMVTSVISFFSLAAIISDISFDSQNHSITGADALARAKNQIPKANEYQSVVSYNSYPPASEDVEYILENSDMKTVRKIFPKQIPTSFWQVRFFKPLEKEEYHVYFLPTGELYEITHVLDEGAAGINLSQEEALKIAKDYLTKMHEDEVHYNLKETHSDKKPKRTDFTFTFVKTDWKVGDAEIRADVSITGNEPTHFNKYIHLPEDWVRERQKTTFIDFVIAIATFFPVILLIIYGVIIFFKLLRQKVLKYKQALFYTIPFVVISVLQILNKLPLFYAGYITSVPISSYTISRILNTSVSLILIILLMSVFIAIFLALWKLNFGELIPAERKQKLLYFRDALFIGYTFPFLLGTIDIISNYITLHYRLFPVSIQFDDLTGVDQLSPVFTVIYNLSLGIIGCLVAVILLLLLKRIVKSPVKIAIIISIYAILKLISEGLVFDSTVQALIIKSILTLVSVGVITWAVLKIVKTNLLAYIMMVYSGLIFASAWFFWDQGNFFYQINGYIFFILGVLPIAVYFVLRNSKSNQHSDNK